MRESVLIKCGPNLARRLNFLVNMSGLLVHIGLAFVNIIEIDTFALHPLEFSSGEHVCFGSCCQHHDSHANNFHRNFLLF